ncbi:hypothetical protein GWK47_053095 [Chionoecetes opilio]|uniref:Uncharacterized protein n=1 Tax=Chionoecetes opilio TaxID=41210 RepID=A0A8J4XZF4_CHIOP|nr:hypothetical protein GWK47_053095 [Chionoecetes opilio]
MLHFSLSRCRITRMVCHVSGSILAEIGEALTGAFHYFAVTSDEAAQELMINLTNMNPRFKPLGLEMYSAPSRHIVVGWLQAGIVLPQVPDARKASLHRYLQSTGRVAHREFLAPELPQLRRDGNLNCKGPSRHRLACGPSGQRPLVSRLLDVLRPAAGDGEVTIFPATLATGRESVWCQSRGNVTFVLSYTGTANAPFGHIPSRGLVSRRDSSVHKSVASSWAGWAPEHAWP